MIPANSQRSLPPSSGYYAYGATVPPYGGPYGFQGSKLPQDETSMEAQEETLELSKPMKKKSKGFLGFDKDDFLAMALVFLLPLLIFAMVYMLIAYYWHYKYVAMDFLLILVIFGFVVYLSNMAMKHMFRTADGVKDHMAIWAGALLIGAFLGFFLALIFGWRNYDNHTKPLYEWKELNKYTNVDPNTMEGKAFMDAGSITFNKGTHLDFGKSVGFMNLDMYCAVPIVNSGAAPTTYDFWAVGVNCCTGAAQSFACGEAVHSDTATGGLRLMSDSQLPFFQMAVTQASTKYGTKSGHPIFVHWVEDAKKALDNYAYTSWDSFMFAVACFAGLQVVVLVASAFGVMVVKSKYA
jgi:hypothetical protein